MPTIREFTTLVAARKSLGLPRHRVFIRTPLTVGPEAEARGGLYRSWLTTVDFGDWCKGLDGALGCKVTRFTSLATVTKRGGVRRAVKNLPVTIDQIRMAAGSAGGRVWRDTHTRWQPGDYRPVIHSRLTYPAEPLPFRYADLDAFLPPLIATHDGPPVVDFLRENCPAAADLIGAPGWLPAAVTELEKARRERMTEYERQILDERKFNEEENDNPEEDAWR